VSIRGTWFDSGIPGNQASQGALDPTTGDDLAVTRPSLALITDGTSNTLLFEERAGLPDKWVRGGKTDVVSTNSNPFGSWASWWGPWLQPFDTQGTAITSINAPCVINCANFAGTNPNQAGVYSFHTGGVNVAFADGSVRFLSASISTRTFVALLSRGGGEVITSADF
jgi:prepilin-type processing-associated H-X9-DG protein